MNLPNYRTEPGLAHSITDMIIDRVPQPDRDRYQPIRWKVSYQGETDYDCDLGNKMRLSFRWGKCPWMWGYEPNGTSYWNYPDEATFQHEFNGAWGILRGFCANPVSEEILLAFRELYIPEAVTGYWDHEAKSWVVCEPTERELSTESYRRTRAMLLAA